MSNNYMNSGNSEMENTIRMENVDKIEDLLALTDPIEMDSRILKNTNTITKILRIFYKKLCDNFHIGKEETDILLYCLKFIDTLNLFMTNQSIELITKIIYDINELVAMINTLESKDIILKKIKYTEMTVIYYRKKFFKNLFYGEGNILGKEIEKSLNMVMSNGNFEQKLFKQMQNIFWVVKSKIEEKYQKEIQHKLTEMKAISLKSKKNRFNFYEDYDDYADYKNYSHTDVSQFYDYYDNFNYNVYENYWLNNENQNINGNKIHEESSSNFDYNNWGYNNINTSNQTNIHSNTNQTTHATTTTTTTTLATTNATTNATAASNLNINPNQNTNSNSKINSSITTQYDNYNEPKNNNMKNRKYSHHGNNKNKISEAYVQTQIDVATNNSNNIENNSKQNEQHSIGRATNNQAIINKPNENVEVIVNVVKESKPVQKNNIQNYYNDNFFKSYLYYYEKPNKDSVNLYSPAQNSYQVTNIPNIISTNTNAANAITPIKKNKNKKNRTKSTEEDVSKQDTIKTIKSKATKNIIIDNMASKIISKEDSKISPEKVQILTENQKPENEIGKSYLEPAEIITTQINSNKQKSSYNYNNNYNFKNGKYKYGNYYNQNYNNQYKNNYYLNNYDKNYYYGSYNNGVNNMNTTNPSNNSAEAKPNEGESNSNNSNTPISSFQNTSNNNLMNYRKSFNSSPSTHNSNNVRKEKSYSYAYNQTYNRFNNKIVKHEFVDLDEINKKETTSSEIIINNIPEQIIEKVELKKNSEEKKELVDIDVEKMFQLNEKDKTNLEVNTDNKLISSILSTTSEKNENIPSESSMANKEEIQLEKPESYEVEVEFEDECNEDEGIEDNEDNEDNEENEDKEENEDNEDNEYNEDDDDSDSVDNELIQADFDNFIRESNLGSISKNYNDDNYYDIEENTKNNKIIFEDDNNALIQKDFNEDKNTNIGIESEKTDLETIENDIKDNDINNIQGNDSNLKESTRGFLESLKTIDPKVLLEIKTKLNDIGKKPEENKDTQNNLQDPNSQIHSVLNITTDEYNNYKSLNRTNMHMKSKVPNYIFTNYAHFFYRGRDSNIHREYFALKYLEQETGGIVSKNLEQFENKILIPIYQRINYNVNKKRGVYFYTFTKYKKLIYRVLAKEKILKKVKPYGSYMNNFLIESGDIDICIVPKCGILEFSNYLEMIKEEIILQNIGENKLTHHNSRYMLLKVVDYQTRFVIDITVHNMLPILNTNLLRLYSLFDQRFHILGLYIKHWGKINKIHGAADNYLSSYAFLLMLINFLQNIIEPKVLPNLQKIENKEIMYEYEQNGEVIKTNIYYEEDVQKIRNYMNTVNNGNENTDSASQLLVKFFEYYSYYYDYYDQKLSIHKNIQDSFKKSPDTIAFSIDDPFDPHHNPGKSMIINSPQFNKFITSMKKEINFILNGEYVKRLDKVGGSRD